VAANHAATHLDETKLPRCFLQSALRVESWNFACEPLHTYETYECCKSSNQDTVVGSSSTLPSSALRIHPPCFTARWSSMNPASTGRVSTSLSAQVEGIATAALQTSNRWLRKKKTMFFFENISPQSETATALTYPFSLTLRRRVFWCSIHKVMATSRTTENLPRSHSNCVWTNKQVMLKGVSKVGMKTCKSMDNIGKLWESSKDPFGSFWYFLAFLSSQHATCPRVPMSANSSTAHRFGG